MALQSRPPVITIMGHVDHGKTTLLDYIRQSQVAAKESGGITQHIGAYQVEYKGKKLTFIDTPGHAAFNKMRERGAQLTDIVILVVAANDGVKPQTIESIRHIQSAKVQTVVAINKIDLPDIHIDVVKGQLAENGILVSGFGGDIEVVELSAKTGVGVDKLLETLGLIAELQDYKADPEAALEAVVIESFKDPRRGSVASVIVQQGTLKPRQDVYTQTASGRIRMLTNEHGKALRGVTPGSPAEIIGFKDVPNIGEIVKDATAEYAAKVEAAEEIKAEKTETPAADQFADFDFSQVFEEKPKLKLIIRADVKGTLEAIVQTLDYDSVDLLFAGLGQVTDGDVDLAEPGSALIIAFNTQVPRNVKQLAKDHGVRIKQYDVIYTLIEDLQKQMLKLMDSTIDEIVIGEAEIMQIFEMRGEKIAGVKVKTGEMKRNDLLHLKRADEIIANPVIKSMMHGKEEIQSIKAKNEGGMTFKNRRLDFQVGDVIVAYKLEE
ncbi:MAG: translation initiation factor IF-2 [Candidatus Pacebacteria bacterium CG_4_10_14_0_8_um_filter_43_12]|nr:MAG: translation initiation factor IF-2 [Candidatus Pacebacteria bacterium CG_4_10_14_0_8_um_filter_43_12]